MISADTAARLRIVLVRTRNPLNIGAAARAMSNFGISRLRVVNPFELAFREARSAVGAADVLRSAEEFTNLADAVSDCVQVIGTTAARNRQLQHALRPLDEGATLIRKQLRTAPVALLFGSEKTGLSKEDLSHCHWLIRIPTAETHLSMNLGQAVAVCLYEIVRDAMRVARKQERTRVTAHDAERITEALFKALRASDYVKSDSGTVTGEKVRRLVRRLNLRPDDAEVLLGMLRQILWKLRQEQK